MLFCLLVGLRRAFAEGRFGDFPQTFVSMGPINDLQSLRKIDGSNAGSPGSATGQSVSKYQGSPTAFSPLPDQALGWRELFDNQGVYTKYLTLPDTTDAENEMPEKNSAKHSANTSNNAFWKMPPGKNNGLIFVNA